MSEKDQSKAQAEQQFSILKIYIKDISFESPQAPALFSGERTISPDINVQLGSEINKIADDTFEVVLELSVTATEGEDERPVYLVELKQAGIFLLKCFDRSTHEALLGGHCPAILFPFARQVIGQLIANGGFPQLLLEPINFEALYAQHKKVKQTAPAPTTTQ